MVCFQQSCGDDDRQIKHEHNAITNVSKKHEHKATSSDLQTVVLHY